MILFLTSVLLLLSFIVHLFWWRVKMPAQTTNMLLLIFFGLPMMVGIIWYEFSPLMTLQPHEVTRLALLYISCAFVYIILYSAIEQQSPTLAIIAYLNNAGKYGCDEETLIHHLKASEEIEKRLFIMKQEGWIQQEDNWHLTKKGKRIAYIFEYGSIIFGLKKGG